MLVINIHVYKNFQSFPDHTLFLIFHFYIYISMSHRTDLTAHRPSHHVGLISRKLLGTLSVPERGFHGFLLVSMGSHGYVAVGDRFLIIIIPILKSRQRFRIRKVRIQTRISRFTRIIFTPTACVSLNNFVEAYRT